MGNKKIVFVILHYNVKEETDKCINSIKEKIDTEEYKIIIVDNASKNGSGPELAKQFVNDQVVEVIINKENYGFAKGNNIGCAFAIEKYSPQFLCVINNDTELDSSNIYSEVSKVYEKTKFHACGPMIWNSLGDFNQNPFLVSSNLKEINREYKKLKIRNYFAQKNLYIIFSAFDKIMTSLFNKQQRKTGSLGLNGAAIIFSDIYYQKYKSEIFVEKTFLYFEEAFLYFRKQQDNLNFVYNNNIKFLHNESISTRSSFNNTNARWKFQMKYLYESIAELRQSYIDNSKNY